MKRSIALILSLILFSVLAVAQTNTPRAGRWHFQIGIGPSVPFYDAGTDAFFTFAESVPGVDRYELGLSMGLGYGISPTSMIFSQIVGTGDMLTDGIDTFQMNLYLYGIGTRWYPGESGFYVSGLVGPSRAVFLENGTASSSSPWGYGFGLALGKEFSARQTGFSLALEGIAFTSYIDGNVESSAMLNLVFAWR